MKRIRRSVILPYSTEALYELVADVESYPDFLPGCVGAKVHERTTDSVVASLEMARGVLRGSFTTRNKLSPPEAMTMELMGGAFKSLIGEWRFEPLGDGGCEAVLDVSFNLGSGLAESLIRSQVEGFCAELVNAFVLRARTLHG